MVRLHELNPAAWFDECAERGDCILKRVRAAAREGKALVDEVEAGVEFCWVGGCYGLDSERCVGGHGGGEIARVDVCAGVMVLAGRGRRGGRGGDGSMQVPEPEAWGRGVSE